MIEFITPDKVYPVRHKVLRKDKPFESSFFNGDTLKSTFHLGYLINDKIVSVLSLIKNEAPISLDILSNSTAYQLRGMATLESFQGKGIGFQLLSFAEDYLRSINCDLIWCNARVNAIPFYKKSNYNIIGNAFLIPSVGEHYVMTKSLVTS